MPSRWWGPQYVPMLEDIVRMVCIQFTIQLLIYLNSTTSGNGAGASFFTPDFALMLLYVVLGVMLYWLAIRKIVALR